MALIGNGLLGAALDRQLRAAGAHVQLVSRSPIREAQGRHLAADLTTASGQDAIGRWLKSWRPEHVLLAHGPVGIEACAADIPAAIYAHRTTVQTVAELGAPVVLVSSDCVHDGTYLYPAPDAPARPAHAYGLAKDAAEREAFRRSGCAVVRVTQLYGWSAPGQRRNFVERCIALARRREGFTAPHDQWFQPAYVEDVSACLLRLALEPTLSPHRAHHVAGPCVLSRFELAQIIVRAVGATSDLVRAIPRSETEWRERPAFSTLHPSVSTALLRTPSEGVTAMLLAEREPTLTHGDESERVATCALARESDCVTVTQIPIDEH